MTQNDERPVMAARHLGYTYTDGEARVEALRDVSLDIRRGDFVCVLGPSGCGKSTWLNLLAGYLTPTAGEVLMDGRPVAGPDKRREVLFQSDTLYPWLTVAENVAFGPRLAKAPKAERAATARRYLEEVQLADYADAKTFELSGGMKQRVALARLMANHPEVILMDEPLGALDAMTRRSMQAFIRDVWNEHRATFFLITHDIDEALALGTKVVVMTPSPGSIAQVFDVGFTRSALGNAKRRVVVTREYHQLKERILDIIEGEEA